MSFRGYVSKWYTFLFFQKDTVLHKVKSILTCILSTNPMTKSLYEIDVIRKELHELAEIQKLGLGRYAKVALHDRMLTVAFQLQEATA